MIKNKDLKTLWNNFLLIFFIVSGIYGVFTKDLILMGVAIFVLAGRIFSNEK